MNNLTNQVFGRLTATSDAITLDGRLYYTCKCECGTIKTVRQDALTSGATKSCGCYQKELPTTHGASKTRLYKIWSSMIQRCRHSRNLRYKGRGITVCKEWESSYLQFINDMGTPPSPKHQLDRINNTLGYSQKNCHWATPSENMQNQERSIVVSMDGETKHLKQWAESLHLPYSTLRSRWYEGKRGVDLLHSSHTHTIESEGVTHSLSEWAVIHQIPLTALRARFYSGKRAPEIFAPLNTKKQRSKQYDHTRRTRP